MGGWFAKEIAAAAQERQARRRFMMGHLLKQRCSTTKARGAMGGMLVGSIDLPPRPAIAKIVTMIGARTRSRRARPRISMIFRRCTAGARSAARWPHNPVVLRKASRAATLGGRDIPAGADVIAWIHAAMYDEQVFPDPTRLRPDRDGRAYLHLGGGIHPCSGRPVNAFQIPLLVAGLLRRDLVRVGRIGWAGPFPHRLPAVLGGGRA